jgi:putative NADH-flavin reductase
LFEKPRKHDLISNLRYLDVTVAQNVTSPKRHISKAGAVWWYMKLTIFGATGGIGSALLDRAVGAGHVVTVLARNPAKLATAAARVVRGDASDAGAVGEAISSDTDVVLSALGPRQSHDPVMATATQAILLAMQAKGISRFVGISASGLHVDSHDFILLKLAKRAIIQRVFASEYANLRLMEDLVVQAPLRWTLVCPPYLNDKPATGAYRMAVGHNVSFGFSMRRGDVAKCMLDVISQPQTYGERVFPAN